MTRHFDFQEAQELIYTKEVLTAQEAEVCFTIIPAMAKEYLFHHTWNDTYLNLYLYSEVEKEAYDLKREMGI